MTVVKAKTRNIDGSRHYLVEIDGKPFDPPSVNTLKGKLKSGALDGWLMNRHLNVAHQNASIIGSMTADAARRFVRSTVASDKHAIEYGNEVHEIAEAVLLGDELPVTKVLTEDESIRVARNVDQLVTEFEIEPLFVEQAVVYVNDAGTPIYAGTADLIAKTKLGTFVLDWKSGASGIWDDAALTTGGYAKATHLLIDGELVPMPPIDGAWAVWLRPEGYAVHPLDIEYADEVLVFLAAISRWQDQKRVAPAINDKPLRRART